MYSNPDKREKERSFFEAFRSARTDLHIRNPCRGEPPEPDYVFSISEKKIGLEVTSPVNELLAPIRTAQDRCLKRASQVAKQIGLETVGVRVQFRSDRDPIDIDEAAEELVRFVESEIPKIDDTKSWHCHESGLKYIKWISIRLGTINGRAWLRNHRFERIHMNWVGIDPVAEIQSLIDKKQSKYDDYIKACDECWLLVGVNEWTAPEAVAITETLRSHVFSGDFRRLFFLRNIEGSVAELRISGHI